jgi:hypothetical protein
MRPHPQPGFLLFVFVWAPRQEIRKNGSFFKFTHRVFLHKVHFKKFKVTDIEKCEHPILRYLKIKKIKRKLIDLETVCYIHTLS